MRQFYKNKCIYYFCGLLFFSLVLFNGSVNAQLITLGTGTTASANTDPSPVNGYYNFIRHQALYTKAEINAAGVTGPALITKLAYFITAIPAGGTPNWELRVANTTAADASAHNPATLTTVYTSALPTWTANAWNTLTFSTPFLWDGTSNLLVDVDLGSAPFTTPYGSLYTYTATNGSRYIRCDACGSQAASTTTTALNVKPQVQLTFTAASPCSGTPAPGNTIASANPVCGAVNFTLSAQNSTSGTGVTYQWQSSPNGSTWTPITGATSPTYTTSQNVATYYRVLVTCGGTLTGNSTGLLVALNTPANCYCTPPATNCGASDVITNVTIGTINNTSACSANGYTDYSSTVAATNLTVGSTVPMTVTVGPGGTEYVGVWIDYNQNGTFETSEFTALGSANGAVVAGSIVVPAGATTGLTKMRVRVRYSTANIGTDACTAYTYGETEDYKVNIVANTCSAGAFTTQPSNATLSCGSNTSFVTAATGTAVTYQWQVSTDGGATYNNITNGGVYGGATTNTLTLTAVPATYNNYKYRVVLNGTCTPANFASNAATLTVTQPVAPTVTPTSAVVCAGGIAALSIGTATTSNFTSGTIAVGVPDNSLVGATHTIPVSGIPAGATITGITVAYNMNHTWDGDMVFALKAPSGAILNLDFYLSTTFGTAATTGFTNTRFSSTGASGTIGAGTAPYNSIFVPDGIITGGNFGQLSTSGGPTGYTPTVTTFAALISSLASANGNWTLAMYDGGAGDVGTLTSWTVSITYTSAGTGIWAPTTGLFTDAAGTVPYTGTAISTIYAKPAATTTYSVTTAAGGCTSPATSVTVTVNTPPSVTTQPTAMSVCENGNTTFSAVGGGTGPTYQWQVSTDNGATFSNIAGATNNTYTVSGATLAMNGNKFRVVVTGTAPCGSVNSSAVNLTVNALPKVTLSASPTTKLIPTTTTTLTASVTPAGNGTFKWFRNGTQVSGAAGNSIVVNIDKLGDYTAQVTDANGCTSLLSGVLTISDTASGKLFLYPNPNNGKFHVRFYTPFYLPNALPPTGVNSIEVRYISVYDALGHRVMDQPFSVYAPYGSMDVDLTAFGKGIYWIQVKDVQGHKLAIGRAVVL